MLKEAALTPDNAGDPLLGDDDGFVDDGFVEDERRPIWLPRPHFVLGLALLLSLPSILGFVQGTLDIGSMLVRFLIGLLVAWLGLVIVGNVINAYLPPPPAEVIPHALGEGDDLSNLVGYDATANGLSDAGPADNSGLSQEDSPETPRN